MKHLSESRENALRLVKKLNRWERINCTAKGEMLTREKIAEKVWSAVKKAL